MNAEANSVFEKVTLASKQCIENGASRAAETILLLESIFQARGIDELKMIGTMRIKEKWQTREIC